jgi:hypothetical protein
MAGTAAMTHPNPNTKMPKWLLYGLIAKGVLVAAITIGIVAYVSLK